LHQITEDDIKKAVLKFLRGYYKHRPRSGEIEISSDLRGAGGIVADGFLAFKEEDGRNFIVTFEATDFHHRDELRFTLLKPLQYWDAVAMGYLSVASLFIIAHVQKWLALLPHYFWIGVLLLQVLIAGFAVIWYYLLRKLRRYRYIYAIQQFNEYFADDQWVAYAHEVFPGYDDPYFKELSRQCIFYGFGMVEVDEELRVKLHMAPSIDDPDFQLKRRVVQFFTKNDFTQVVQRRLSTQDWWDKITAQLQRIPYRENLQNLFRFKRPVYKQMGVILACVGAMTLVLAREFKKKPIRYVNEATYEQEMTTYMGRLYGNENLIQDIILDSTDIRPYVKNVFPYIYQNAQSLDPQLARNTRERIIIYTSNGFVHYPCQRFTPVNDQRYMVTMGVFYDTDLLKRAIQRFRKLGVSVNGIWGACFFEDKKHYLLFLEDLYANPQEAGDAANQAKTRLKQAGIQLDIAIKRI
jgi:hypothetical protein